MLAVGFAVGNGWYCVVDIIVHWVFGVRVFGFVLRVRVSIRLIELRYGFFAGWVRWYAGGWLRCWKSMVLCIRYYRPRLLRRLSALVCWRLAPLRIWLLITSLLYPKRSPPSSNRCSNVFQLEKC